ncbi:MAG: hypothetical protein ACW975_13640, partial [Candidatus Thorarchaeota archaeon]
MESDANIGSADFKTLVDSTFETLLTITTILSGVYVAISFDWFAQALAEPHPGEPISPEMVTQAITGVFLGLIFILPLTIVVLAWALFKFRGSSAWRTVAWSAISYCLAQDFVGVLALLMFPLIAENIFVGPLLIAAVVFVIIMPTTLGITLGYRVTVRYDRDLLALGARKRSYALTAITTVIAILTIQAILG